MQACSPSCTNTRAWGEDGGRTGAAQGKGGWERGSWGMWHWLIGLAVVLVLWGGGGKISTLMGDMAKGIKSFKKHMADDEPMEGSSAPQQGGQIPPPPAGVASTQQAGATVDQTVRK